MSINHITEENFVNVSPAMLLDPKWYPEVEDVVLNVDAADTGDYAKEYGGMLASKLAEAGARMPEELKGKYFTLLKILRLSALEATPDIEKEKFFNELILAVFQTDLVDPKSKLDTFFRGFYNDPQAIEHYRGLFLRALEKNQEVLGAQNLQVDTGADTKTLRPTLANWVTDYNYSTHLSSDTHRRGGFEQTNYFLHSPNTKNLDKAGKDALLKFLQFYDWLRFDPLKYDFSLPGQEPWEDETVEFAKPEKVLPEDLAELIEKLRAAPSDTTKDIQGLNYMVGKSGVMSEPVQPQKPVANISKPAAALPPRAANNPVVNPPPKMPPLVPKGPAPRSLMDIKADIENKKRKAQEEIDKKLDELKRKVQK